MKFKTLKQKILHHARLDKGCRDEKINLVKILELFYQSFNQVITKYNLDINEIEKFKEIKNLKKSYDSLTKTFSESDLLFSTIGDTLVFKKQNI